MTATQTYRVTEILGSRPWPADGDTKVIYYNFRAEGVDKVCNIGRKPGNELKVGDTFQATAEEDRGQLKLKAQQQGGFGGGGPRPEDPKRAKRIQRMHSQTVAVETLQLAQSLGFGAPFASLSNVNDLVGLVKTVADAYDKDVQEAGERQ